MRMRMTSPAKRAANRRNALKSTGPRGAEGRRKVSLNATKHGLSVPLDEFLRGPQILLVAGLIHPECSTNEEANELARRILDFERNEAVQRGYLQEDASCEMLEDPRAWSHQRRLQATRQQFSEFDEVQDFLEEFTATGQAISSDQLQVITLRRQMTQAAYAQAKRDFFKAQKERVQSLRYLRRAGNQLVKGVRSLAITVTAAGLEGWGVDAPPPFYKTNPTTSSGEGE